MKKFFSSEGWLLTVLQKTGEVILLNALFVVCCIPVVTVGPAVTSFYYAMIKSIRRDRSGPIVEFFASMKRTAGKGILLTVGLAAWYAVLFLGRYFAQNQTGFLKYILYVDDAFLLISVLITVYLFPAFSRFSVKTSRLLKLSFAMSVRFFPITLLLIAGTAATAAVLYLIPFSILVMPGIWCFASTFLVERPLRAYMPPPQPGDEEEWYYYKKKKRTEEEKARQRDEKKQRADMYAEKR